MFLTAKMVPNLMTKSQDQKIVVWKIGNNFQLGPLTCAENAQDQDTGTDCETQSRLLLQFTELCNYNDFTEHLLV